MGENRILKTKGFSKSYGLIILTATVGIFLLFVSGMSEEYGIKQEEKIFEGISYNTASGKYIKEFSPEINFLQDLPHVKWVNVENNTIYIGCDYRSIKIDPDIPGETRYSVMETSANVAAFKCNRKINFGVHVYVLNTAEYPTSQSRINDTNWKFQYTTTYRHGKKEK